MDTCRFCGAELYDEIDYCLKCGKSKSQEIGKTSQPSKVNKGKWLIIVGVICLSVWALYVLIDTFTYVTSRYLEKGGPIFIGLFCGLPAASALCIALGIGPLRNTIRTGRDRAARIAEQVSVSESPQYASFWRRAAAFAIDDLGFSVIITAGILLLPLIVLRIPPLVRTLFWPVGMKLEFSQAMVAQVIQVFWGLGAYFIFSFPLWIWRGQTLGKKLLGIKVVDRRGNDLNWVQCLARPAIYLLEMTVCLGFLWCLWDKEKRCWHDLIARTHVVRLR